MARRPEVFVRELEPEEAQRLVQITRRTKDRIRLRRAGIVLASFQGRSASEAAAMFAASPGYARDVIKSFNEMGFDALNPKWSGGRPRRIGPAVREQICRIARTPPGKLGEPFTTWSLTKLRDHLAEVHKVRASTGDDSADPAPVRDLLAGHQDMEGIQGPRLRAEDGQDPRPVRQPAHRWTGDLCR